jgi:hypothetical protein
MLGLEWEGGYALDAAAASSFRKIHAETGSRGVVVVLQLGNVPSETR